MWDLLRVALRNVGRNKRRSLITAITVFIGVLVIAGTRGLLNGLQGEIRSALTQKMHGDVQLHLAGYQDSIDASPYKVMFRFDTALQQTLKDTPGVVAWSPRLRALGLLDAPYKGAVYLDGTTVSYDDFGALAVTRSRIISFIFQAFNLNPMLTLEENAMVPLMIRRWSSTPATAIC